jgi:hypothetical protein
LAQQQKHFEDTAVRQQKRIEALTATVQKMSDRLQLNNSEPQLVANYH